MSEVVCPICEKRVSDWTMAVGNACFTVEGRLVHNACVADMTIREVSERINGSTPAWPIGVRVAQPNR